MSCWLFKSEPSTYSIDDLANDKKTWWDGVRNYQARNFMRDDMQIGDGVLFYHSSCSSPAIVGEACVSQQAQPDISQFDSDSPYFDAAATPAKPRWWYVEISFVRCFPKPLFLSTIRHHAKLIDMLILRRGNRLSITPLTKAQWQTITDVVSSNH